MLEKSCEARRNRRVAGSLFALLMLPALACAAPESEEKEDGHVELGSAEQGLYVASTLIWPSRTIPVCWETAGNDTEKAWVRGAVEESWQRHSGVNFTGWGVCNGSTNAGIRIETADTWPRVDDFGKNLNNRVNGMHLNFWFNFQQVNPETGVLETPFSGCQGTRRESCIRSIGVHEFGHALGFAHEQARDDKPASCTEVGNPDDADSAMGRWDYASVMDYCNALYNNDGRLSDGDVAGVVRWYGMPGNGTVCQNGTTTYVRTQVSCNAPPTCAPGETQEAISSSVFGFCQKYRITCRTPDYVTCDHPRVAAVNRTSTSFDLFIVGQDGRVYTSWAPAGGPWSGVNNNWRALGGFFPVGAPVTAVTRTANNLDLFVIGNDGRVYHSWWAAGSDWSGVNDNWRPIGGFFPIGSRVTALARTSNNLDLFVTGNDGRVYHSWWAAGSDFSGVNNNWFSLGGFFPAGGEVAAVARTGTNLDLFITGGDGRVYTRWWTTAGWNSTGNNWMSLGGTFPPGAVARAVARSANNLDLFITGNNGVVYTRWWTPAGWSGTGDNWMDIGGVFPVGATVAVTARTANNLDLFSMASDRRVYTSNWSAGGNWSGIGDRWTPIGGFF